MIIVRVRYRTPEGQRDAFLQQMFDEGLPQACRAEEGNICYDYFLNYEDPNEILLLEMWKDGTALAKHGKEPRSAGKRACRPRSKATIPNSANSGRRSRTSRPRGSFRRSRIRRRVWHLRPLLLSHPVSRWTDRSRGLSGALPRLWKAF